jgi:hypothetical protein
MMLSAVGLVLLIACVNIANLLLSSRGGEGNGGAELAWRVQPAAATPHRACSCRWRTRRRLFAGKG